MADEAGVIVPESKRLKLETDVSSNEPEEPPCASASSAEPTTVIEGDATIIENEPPTTKPRVADPSFKEMPYTLLSPDDPALATCV